MLQKYESGEEKSQKFLLQTKEIIAQRMLKVNASETVIREKI